MDRPLDLKLGSEDMGFCARAVAHYCKHLDGLAEKATKVNLTTDAGHYEGMAAGLRAEIVEPYEAGERFELYARHRPAIEKGLEFLATNTKAAKGTVKPLGYQDVITRCETDASHIEGALLPLFQEQAELGLEGPRLVTDEGAAELQRAAQEGD